jgi:hypothetical protein
VRLSWQAVCARFGHYALVVGDDFRAEALRVMKDGTPSSGYNLDGMATDFDALLWDLPEINGDSVNVQRTEHAERLIRASCQAVPGVSIVNAGEAVRGLWLSSLRYAYLEAHELHVTNDMVTLDFITQMSPQGLYVTGAVTIVES